MLQDPIINVQSFFDPVLGFLRNDSTRRFHISRRVAWTQFSILAIFS